MSELDQKIGDAIDAMVVAFLSREYPNLTLADGLNAAARDKRDIWAEMVTER